MPPQLKGQIDFARLTRVAAVIAIAGMGSVGTPVSPVSAETLQGQLPVIKGQTVAPTVDLDVLKNRLRMTDAIGFFNKISLNRRIEKLIEHFRRFHHGDGTVSLAALTGQFSTLIDETLTLVQQGDQDLHATIKAAKGGLWRLFSNRIEFAKAFGGRNVAMVPDKIEGD